MLPWVLMRDQTFWRQLFKLMLPHLLPSLQFSKLNKCTSWNLSWEWQFLHFVTTCCFPICVNLSWSWLTDLIPLLQNQKKSRVALACVLHGQGFPFLTMFCAMLRSFPSLGLVWGMQWQCVHLSGILWQQQWPLKYFSWKNTNDYSMVSPFSI